MPIAIFVSEPHESATLNSSRCPQTTSIPTLALAVLILPEIGGGPWLNVTLPPLNRLQGWTASRGDIHQLVLIHALGHT